jgi:hypothetical protein
MPPSNSTQREEWKDEAVLDPDFPDGGMAAERVSVATIRLGSPQLAMGLRGRLAGLAPVST